MKQKKARGILGRKDEKKQKVAVCRMKLIEIEFLTSMQKLIVL
jgi:hypothetical protein